jgi:hypothetical protein
MDAPIQSRAKSFLRDLKNVVSSVLKWLFGLAILAFVAWRLLPDDWRVKYTAEYMLNDNQVVIERKPHNCDWDSAPLGNKHCHYEKVVTVYNQDGKIIEGPAPTLPAPSDQKPAKVYVQWQRIDD